MATIEKLEKSKVKLTMEIPADVFADAMQKAYLKEGKRYSVPGFRKGKAPRKVLENMYGEGIFYEAAFEFGSTDFVHDERRRVGSVGRHLSRVDVPAFVGLAFEDDVELSG